MPPLRSPRLIVNARHPGPTDAPALRSCLQLAALDAPGCGAARPQLAVVGAVPARRGVAEQGWGAGHGDRVGRRWLMACASGAAETIAPRCPACVQLARPGCHCLGCWGTVRRPVSGGYPPMGELRRSPIGGALDTKLIRRLLSTYERHALNYGGVV